VEDAECYIQKNEDKNCLVKRYIDSELGNCDYCFLSRSYSLKLCAMIIIIIIIITAIIRPHCSTAYIDEAYCYRPSSMVYLSVCLSVTVVSPAKTAEPIEMPFGLRNRVGPRNHVLHGVQIPHGQGQF